MAGRTVRERSIAAVRRQITEAKHHFQLLGVHRGSAERDLVLATRDLALYVHPSVCALKDAADLMARVSAAHSELAARMDLYVQELGGEPCAACKGRGRVTRQRGRKSVVTACDACHGAGVLV